MIVGQNALLNQYVPTFYIRDLRDGQGVIYDSVRKAFVNADIGGGTGGVDRLGELLDVSSSVDNPLSLQNGQALTYNSFTSLWENTFVDYNTLLNKPTIGTGSVTSIAVDGTTGRILSSGSPITTSGTITLDLATTTVIPGAYAAANITVDAYGRITSATNGVGGGGSVTTVSVVTANGISGTVATASTTPAITLTLGAITPTSVAASGLLSGSNLSGTNTGDQTITLTGDVTGSGTGSFATSLATVNASPQIDTFRKITVNSKGLVTATSSVVAADITTALGFTPYNSTNPAGYTTNTGTVTTVSVVTANGVSGIVATDTTTPAITLTLGAITPTSVVATGTVTGTNLSGTNTGDQTITLTGDVTGTGTGTFATSLATVNLTPGTYGDDHLVPTIVVNAKGLVTSITTQHVDTTARDLVPETETFTVSARHQYIVTSQLEVDGMIINNGVIAIL